MGESAMKPIWPLLLAAMLATSPIWTQTDDAGFAPIFDGKTLTGWDGDPTYWRVENGCITGETKPENLPKHNTFIVWRGGTTKDFELKLQYRITAFGNS